MTRSGMPSHRIKVVHGRGVARIEVRPYAIHSQIGKCAVTQSLVESDITICPGVPNDVEGGVPVKIRGRLPRKDVPQLSSLRGSRKCAIAVERKIALCHRGKLPAKSIPHPIVLEITRGHPAPATSPILHVLGESAVTVPPIQVDKSTVSATNEIQVPVVRRSRPPPHPSCNCPRSNRWEDSRAVETCRLRCL